MSKVFLGNKGYKLLLGNVKVKRGYIGNKIFYTGAVKVYYHIDDTLPLMYMEEVEEGYTCLSPTSFNPAGLKTGFTFVGWRSDNTPTDVVYDEYIAGEEDIHLYAVYKKILNIKLYNGSITPDEFQLTLYYNNGNNLYPKCTSEQSTLRTVSGYSVKTGWSYIVESYEQNFNSGEEITFKQDTILYSIYSQNTTVYVVNGNNTKVSYAGVRHKQYSETIHEVHPAITLSHTNLANYNNAGWSITANNITKSYDDGSVSIVPALDNKTFYALYSQIKTVNVVVPSSATASSKVSRNITRVTEFLGNGSIFIGDAPISLTHVAISGWSNAGWNSGQAANVSVYSDGTAYLPPSMDGGTLYPLYSKSVSVTLYNGSNNNPVKSTASGTRYRKFNGTTYEDVHPVIALGHTSRTGCSNNGWNTGQAANIKQFNDGSFTITETYDSKTLYALYTQTITVSWYNNTTTVSNESKTRYLKADTSWSVINPSFARTCTAVSGWTIIGWTTSQTYATSATYGSGATFTRDSNVSLFACYKKDVVFKAVSAGNTNTQTKQSYYNRGLGSTASQFIPQFSVSNPSSVIGDKTFKGWSTSITATVSYSKIQNLSLSNSATFYAVWRVADAVVFNNPDGQLYEIQWTPFHWRSEKFDLVTINYNNYKSIDLTVSGDMSVGEWGTGTWCFFRLFPGTVPNDENPDPQPYNFELRAINQQFGSIHTDRGPCAEEERPTVTNIPLYQTSGGNSVVCVAFQGDYYSSWCRIYKILAHGKDITW